MRDGVRRRASLGGTGPRDLGDPRQPAPPRVLEGDVLGDGGPRAEAGRRVRPRGPDPGGRRCATRSPTRCASAAGTTRSQSFTAAYDGTDLDAATLHIGLSGLIDPSDPRFAATVVATEAELRSGCDGLPLPPRRRAARHRGRLPPVRGLAGGGLPAHRPALAGRGAVRPARRPPRVRPACSPRSTTRWPSGRWATTRRPTATSGCCAAPSCSARRVQSPAREHATLQPLRRHAEAQHDSFSFEE